MASVGIHYPPDEAAESSEHDPHAVLKLLLFHETCRDEPSRARVAEVVEAMRAVSPAAIVATATAAREAKRVLLDALEWSDFFVVSLEGGEDAALSFSDLAPRGALLGPVVRARPSSPSLKRRRTDAPEGESEVAAIAASAARLWGERASTGRLESDGALAFCRVVGDLKSVPRTGWVRRAVPRRVESVAEHSYRVATLAGLLSSGHACKLALVHDLAEAVCGDIVPGTVTPEEKIAAENRAMRVVLDAMGPETREARALEALWREYETKSSPEARLVKDLDRFEMILQANEYEVACKDEISLQEFVDGVVGKIKHPALQRWFDRLLEGRAARLASGRAPDS